MVVPHLRVAFHAAVIGLTHVVILCDAAALEHDFRVVELRQRGHLDRADLADELHDPLAPLGVQLVPVLVVVPGALLEHLQAPLDLRGIRNGVGGDVDAPIDDPVVDSQGGREGEHAGSHRSHARIGNLRRDHIERRHGLGEMHRVVEPEPLVVLRAKAGVVRIHRLPAFRSGEGADLGRQGEGSFLRI